MIGRVDAPMGTTEVGETYSFKLKGLEREILITDTPGIEEAGIAGTQRAVGTATGDSGLAVRGG
jgi:hypothetical protein